MHRVIIFLLLYIFLASGAFAADPSPIKPMEAGNKKVMKDAPVIKATEPIPDKTAPRRITTYPEYDGYLPRNYQGVSPKVFWEFFKEKVSLIQKSEHETQEAFDLRKTDFDSILSPVKASDLYAFYNPSVIVWYDMREHYFVFRNKEDETLCDEISPEWNSCKIATVENNLTSFLGHFPEGSATVKRTKSTDFTLAIRKSNHFFQSPSVVYDIARMGFEYIVRVPPETAEKLKKYKLGVLFVGSVARAEILTSQKVTSEATYEDPKDTIIQEDAIPFDLKKIVFYVQDTGKILDVQNIQP